ncbi:uncharacterized protein SAPINGB_P003115 [Magnusiomyces paraingens]|uniref:Uncharacterized protein n=1 Tax=Magnusiomyces paraingens TaxID=2606893 RepID=A0A5E8BPQ0_9ASCO|nr:uncharacterized protein SAPINGB_P003115 [Saprochaete ingens]VVT51495.1 unnamed protein product [Saprochaete ingens]
MSLVDNPEFLRKLENDITRGCEMDWLLAHFAYPTGVNLDETPITNFRNYRYKIVDIFNMTYKQEKAVLDAEIATPDVLLILGTYAEYKIMGRLSHLNQIIAKGGHSWAKLLALCKNDVRMLVNTAFVTMHLFAGDLVPLSDNEIVYCYIMAAAVVVSINKSARVALSKDIQRRGLKRPQVSISERNSSRFSSSSISSVSSSSSTSSHTSSLTRTFSSKVPKDNSGISESTYIKRYQDAVNMGSSLGTIDENLRVSAQETPVDLFLGAARRLGVRKSCLQSLASVEKDLPQVGRLLHLGRTQYSFQSITTIYLDNNNCQGEGEGEGDDDDVKKKPVSPVEPQQLVFYIGKQNIATPASDLGDQRYRKPELKAVYSSKNLRAGW